MGEILRTTDTSNFETPAPSFEDLSQFETPTPYQPDLAAIRALAREEGLVTARQEVASVFDTMPAETMPPLQQAPDLNVLRDRQYNNEQ